MSLVALALGAATAADVSASAPPLALPFDQSIEVAVPSLDTGRGLVAGYERWLPDRRWSYELRGEFRESAAGDYTGLRAGIGVEARWFWRAPRGAWLSVLPPNNMAGWFLAAGSYVAADFTHDDEDHRWLGSALQLGVVGRIGYRIVPWRQLAITPSAGLELQRDIDLSGRLAGATRGGLAYGLDVGWLF
jgi:hypothetical protein